MLTEKQNITIVQNRINQILNASSMKKFVVIDGDRTIIPTDSTKYFFEYLGRNYSDLKIIFQVHGYSFEGFYQAANYYSQIQYERYQNACIFSAKSVRIYPEFLAFIEDVRHVAEIILVTSGIYQNWVNIINNHSINFLHVVGGSYLPNDQFIIDKYAKGQIARTLKEAGKEVWAFGDTLIDFDMLRDAHYSFLVVNEKMNKDIIPLAHEIPHLNQVSFGDSLHPNLPTSNLPEVARTINSN